MGWTILHSAKSPFPCRGIDTRTAAEGIHTWACWESTALIIYLALPHQYSKMFFYKSNIRIAENLKIRDQQEKIEKKI